MSIKKKKEKKFLTGRNKKIGNVIITPLYSDGYCYICGRTRGKCIMIDIAKPISFNSYTHTKYKVCSKLCQAFLFLKHSI
jgi:hypothetical protein